MVVIKFDLVLLLIFHVGLCERRITGGHVAPEDKPYVVYLVKAPMSDRKYDSWLCGGALVSSEFIITSAACVKDVKYIYAIAGYKKYVNDKSMETDECFKNMKKRIVYTCVPVSYEFSYKSVEKWSYIDIALAKVESPYNFNDPRFSEICSYVPSTILINFDESYQKVGKEAFVMGWGYNEFWRQRSDKNNYNQDYLRYASTTILDKKKCLEKYIDYPNMTKTINSYTICTCDDLCEEEPKPLNRRKSINDETRKNMSLDKNVNETSILNPTDILNRTSILNQTDTGIVNQTSIVNQTDFSNQTEIVNENIVNERDTLERNDVIYKPGFGNISGFFRRSSINGGICQNDHGDPLVTWVGKKEILIGVASVFRVNGDRKCVGPYLFTSTLCSSAFISCILNENGQNLRTNNEAETRRNLKLCNRPPNEKGYDTIENFVTWKDHPDGPAEKK